MKIFKVTRQGSGRFFCSMALLQRLSNCIFHRLCIVKEVAYKTYTKSCCSQLGRSIHNCQNAEEPVNVFFRGEYEEPPTHGVSRMGKEGFACPMSFNNNNNTMNKTLFIEPNLTIGDETLDIHYLPKRSYCTFNNQSHFNGKNNSGIQSAVTCNGQRSFNNNKSGFLSSKTYNEKISNNIQSTVTYNKRNLNNSSSILSTIASGSTITYRGICNVSGNNNRILSVSLTYRGICNVSGILCCGVAGINKSVMLSTVPCRGVATNCRHLFFHPPCSDATAQEVAKCFHLLPDFVTEEEEKAIVAEVEPHFKRLPYQYDHWDNAIVGFKETEMSRWSSVCASVIKRMQMRAFPTTDASQLIQTHVIDLATDGFIKAHVDSVKFCGHTIAGLCLLSDGIMRLVHQRDKRQCIDVLLPARSVYIMRDEARYDYSHELLSPDASKHGSQRILRGRRISVICRSEP